MTVSKWLSVAAAIAPAAMAMTPAQLISAPRRGEAIPNPSGEFAVFQLTQYSFESHESAKAEWNLLNLESGKTRVLTDDPNVSEMIWLGPEDNNVLYINATNSAGDGGVSLWVADVHEFGSATSVADLPAPLQGLKAVVTDDGDVNFLVFGDSTADGEPYNPDQAKKPLSSARIYDSIFVRHWDYWLTPEYQAVFSGKLTQSQSKSGYNFDGKLTNLVAPVEYAESPYPPFGGASDYDISPDGSTVAFMSKAPEIPKANFTTSYIYIVPHDGSEKPYPINEIDGPTTPKGIRGASSNPVFSPDSKKIAYFQMEEDNYESDRRILYIADISSNATATKSVASDWDRSPEMVKWTPDGKMFYFVVEDAARGLLFSLPTDAGAKYKPKKFTTGGYVTGFHFLGDSNSVLATSSSIWSSAIYSIAKPDKKPVTVLSANEIDPELSGLGPHDVDEFYFKGNWTDIHAYIVKPEGFTEEKTYPLAFMIHGGPQGSWADSWSTRWNPKVWADQGYVVVTPNPTGSTGFGEKLTDAIQNDWGGAPYDDLVKCWEHINDNIPYIDTENGVAAGASYGGFMVNWIQGMPLGRKFKALVSHDGTFVAEAKISTEELFFMQHDFNGTFWDVRENYERFDPAAVDHILAFATPMLVIHSDLDYRLPVSEGLALFNMLQLRGVPSRFLNFPDENHWVLSEENSLVWHQQALGWINKYSGVAENNPDAVQLSDTTVPVVDIDGGVKPQ